MVIVVDKRVCGGKPVISGTRMSVCFILVLLSSGWSIDDIVREYPHLIREDVLAAIRYAEGKGVCVEKDLEMND